MIFALRQPAVLLGLLVGFLVGIAAVTLAQRRFTGSIRSIGSVLSLFRLRRRRRLRRVGGGRGGRGSIGRGSRRTRQHPSTLIDPYGAVAAIVAGIGWGPRPPASGIRRPGPGPLIVALVVHGALAVAGIAGYLAVGGARSLLHGAFGGPAIELSTVLHGSPEMSGQPVVAQMLLAFGAVNLGCGLLRLVPIPPLEAGVLLWSRLPRSPAARRLAYHLLEEAWGVALLLVLLLLPLAGQQPVLLAVLNAVADPLLRLA